MRNYQYALTVVGFLSLAAAVGVAVWTDPNAITLDLFYSITGFCAGFLYASHLWTPSRGKQGKQGPPGERGPRGSS